MADNESASALRRLIGMPASTFVLHRKPMLFLDTLIDIGPESATCEWQAGHDFAFVTAGRGIPAYLGVEYMAQCIAVHAGARARIRGYVPPLGYLLGTRHYRSDAEWFETGVTYEATCQELVRDSQGMGSFACQILRDGDSIAQANLAVLERPQDIRLDERK